MKRLLRLSPLVLVLALVSSSQLSCSVNDYCLNCDKGDGGGSGSGNDGGMDGNTDGGPDAGCVPTGGPEECNGKDDDCNGLIDDDTVHEGEPCPNVQGACAGGVLVCVDGATKQTETCNKTPTPEICDGIDNNCSGPVGTSDGKDEGDPGPAPAMGTAELTAQCGNGIDDDGDTVIDDGCPGAGGKCGTDQGECIAGQFHCDSATGTIKCFNFVDHRGDTEACNGKDDDCDGNFDENIAAGADCGPNTNAGACEFGKILCVGGQPTCGDPNPLDNIAAPVFPKFETCNNIDDDCNNQVDEIFNKNTDIKNCGDCGVVCPTRMNANTTCTPQGNPLKGTCGFACKPGYRDLNGMAVDGCESGPCFPTGVEVCDGDDNDCDGLTDAQDPDLQVPALCLKGGECGGSYTDPNGSNPLGPAPTAQCTGSGGWTCTYPGAVQFPETRCDTKDNNCDGNIDENQPNKGQTCHEDRENPATQCGANTADNDGDGKVNDGCPQGGTGNSARAESLAECLNAIDDDGDGLVNDGCPAVAQLGVCEGTGTYQCDPLNLEGPAYCAISTMGTASSAEACDDSDNDCDGKTDEGGASGSLSGQDWIDLGNGRQMMKYEASRPDANGSTAGSKNNLVCSKVGALPWTNVKYQDALAACQSIGAQLCSESQWHHSCSVVVAAGQYPTYPISFSGTGTYIEAEDYSSIGVGAVSGSGESACTDVESVCTGAADDDSDGRVNDGCPIVMGTAETPAQCENNTDDDGDGSVNDGCPARGIDNDADGVVNDGCSATGNPETQCNDNLDNDSDGVVNDGCPAFGPSPEGTCNEAPASGGVDNDNDGVINDGCPAGGAGNARETACRDGVDDDNDGLINDGCPAAGPAWVPDYTSVGSTNTTNFSGVSAMEAAPNVGVTVTAANAPALAARLDYAVNFTAGTYHVWVKMFANDIVNDSVHVGVNASPPPQTPTSTISVGSSNLNQWRWVDAGTFTVGAGINYVSVYMADDGVKVDRIYLVNGTANPATAESLISKGNKWAYASTPTVYQPNTCNGHDYRQFTISNATRASTGVVTVTTTAAHPFVPGDLIQIQGASSTLDGTYTILTGSGSTFTYQQNTTATTTVSAGTATEARDPTLPTGSLTSCVANTGTGAFDMSGNVREWTLAHSPGENPIRGGASNGTADGISCPLNFTLADDTFFFPNIGFRCCR